MREPGASGGVRGPGASGGVRGPGASGGARGPGACGGKQAINTVILSRPSLPLARLTM